MDMAHDVAQTRCLWNPGALASFGDRLDSERATVVLSLYFYGGEGRQPPRRGRLAGLGRRAIRIGKSAVLPTEPSRWGAAGREPLAAQPVVADFAGSGRPVRNKPTARSRRSARIRAPGRRSPARECHRSLTCPSAASPRRQDTAVVAEVISQT